MLKVINYVIEQNVKAFFKFCFNEWNNIIYVNLPKIQLATYEFNITSNENLKYAFN